MITFTMSEISASGEDLGQDIFGDETEETDPGFLLTEDYTGISGNSQEELIDELNLVEDITDESIMQELEETGESQELLIEDATENSSIT